MQLCYLTKGVYKYLCFGYHKKKKKGITYEIWSPEVKQGKRDSVKSLSSLNVPAYVGLIL